MKTPKILRTVTDRFDLFNDGRKLSANKRRYIVQAVQKMIANAQTQELLRVGEAYGFYGHQPRQRAGKLSIGETEVLKINGQMVVVENVPSNRTKVIECSDEGIITHTEEVFDTFTGRIIDSLIRSGVGGWSWATGGRDNRRTGGDSITTSYHGMDYVWQPNYLSLDHPAMMMESTEREGMLLESLYGNGFDEESAQEILNSLNNQNVSPEHVAELEHEVMYLESINYELEQKVKSQESATAMLLEAAKSLPFYLTDEQTAALSSLSTDHDRQVVSAMFESVADPKLASLPAGKTENVFVRPKGHGTKLTNDINFGEPSRRFG